jgi:hypothetical protein
MKNINTLYIFLLFFLLSSCDYFACYQFVITNDTNNKVEIKTSEKNMTMDFIFLILFTLYNRKKKSNLVKI